jgi:hypothetical protein
VWRSTVLLLAASTATASPAAETSSAGRGDWPCRLDLVATDAVTWTFDYDGPTACTLPVELAAEGIVGCPTVIRIENPAAHYSSRETLRYDAAGRLTNYDGGGTAHEWIWDHGRLRASKVGRYVVGAHVVELVDGKRFMDIATDERNRAVAIVYNDVLSTGHDVTPTGTVKLVWKGSRLVSIETRSLIDGSVERTTPIYTCPEPARQPARSGRDEHVPNGSG